MSNQNDDKKFKAFILVTSGIVLIIMMDNMLSMLGFSILSLLKTKEFYLFVLLCILSTICSMFFSKKVINLSNLEKIDIYGSKDIYREIIRNYSPIIISFIDQMHYNFDIAIVSGLLSLNNKKIIKLHNNNIEILNKDANNIGLSEKYLLDNINNGKIHINNEYFKNIILTECLDEKLIEKRENERLLMLGTLIIIIFLPAIILIYAGGYVGVMKSFMSLELLMSLFCIWFFLYAPVLLVLLVLLGKNFMMIYRRTSKAKELNKKLEGLKNYLKNYSMLGEKEAQAIALWEDYIIYSVIFMQNQNIVLEYKKYYQKI